MIEELQKYFVEGKEGGNNRYTRTNVEKEKKMFHLLIYLPTDELPTLLYLIVRWLLPESPENFFHNSVNDRKNYILVYYY